MRLPVFVAEHESSADFIRELTATWKGGMFDVGIVRVAAVTVVRDQHSRVEVLAGYIAGNVLVRLRQLVEGGLLPNWRMDDRHERVMKLAAAHAENLSAAIRQMGEAAPRVCGGVLYTESEIEARSAA